VRHHEAAVQATLLHGHSVGTAPGARMHGSYANEEGRQALVQARVHQPLDAPLYSPMSESPHREEWTMYLKCWPVR
jgi:hypothetical protein